MREPTDFFAYSHQQLVAMLQSGDDASVRPAADSWDSVGASLHEQAGNLEAKLAKFQEQWQGGAAEQYRVMIKDLAGGLRRIADSAFAIRDRVHDSADALAKARAEMPPAVEVADLPPETKQWATASLQVPAEASPAMVAELRQRQATAAQAVQQHQQASAAADAAHSKAIAVMTELGTRYRAADQGMPLTDHTAVPGAPVPGGSGGDAEPGGGGEDAAPPGEQLPLVPDPVAKQPSTPLFGNMFTAGLAAASAAGMGRLGTFRPPKVPDWGKPKDPAEEEDDKPTKPVGMPGTGGLSLGGGGGPGAAAPVAAAGLGGAAPATNAMGTAGVLGAAAGAANAAGSGVGHMPMMPMMPFAPGAQDMSGARRIPPWLVETEEVWGESSIVTPSVLGADQSEQRPTF
ncbi:WXG100 family type VII secretion target [Saccharopolyspora hirsuta]|uniref:WXG100 family type VII secretion target n=1 Tax=Saccharopolyspora hirsuta TaxID=1837 RepID=A0A5M7BNF8_SACHI|nr:WXG100 family type VII secretion target [Saccharopolyspora hirsuta]KAA5830570.1 WXG100 family type VII secretion target [Saccharopolyspora hirsuta]